jgi:hypothetical protein
MLSSPLKKETARVAKLCKFATTKEFSRLTKDIANKLQPMGSQENTAPVL